MEDGSRGGETTRNVILWFAWRADRSSNFSPWSHVKGLSTPRFSFSSFLLLRMLCYDYQDLFGEGLPFEIFHLLDPFGFRTLFSGIFLDFFFLNHRVWILSGGIWSFYFWVWVKWSTHHMIKNARPAPLFLFTNFRLNEEVYAIYDIHISKAFYGVCVKIPLFVGRNKRTGGLD